MAFIDPLGVIQTPKEEEEKEVTTSSDPSASSVGVLESFRSLFTDERTTDIWGKPLPYQEVTRKKGKKLGITPVSPGKFRNRTKEKRRAKKKPEYFFSRWEILCPY
jgi:hypothetical protein